MYARDGQRSTASTPANVTRRDADAAFTRDSRGGYLALALAAGTALFIGTMVVLSSGPPEVTLSATQLGVRSGAYGVTVPRREIESATLLQRLSGIGRKQNAFQFGSTYAGRFEVRPHGSTLLFLDATRPPFVQLRWRGTVMIFNARNAAETRRVFDSLAGTAARTSAR